MCLYTYVTHFSKFCSVIQSRIFWTYAEEKCMLMFYGISCGVATKRQQ